MTWKYPLTNVHARRYRGDNFSAPMPSAIVRDADGVVLLQVVGAPYRTNEEAVKMAADLCDCLNRRQVK